MWPALERLRRRVSTQKRILLIVSFGSFAIAAASLLGMAGGGRRELGEGDLGAARTLVAAAFVFWIVHLALMFEGWLPPVQDTWLPNLGFVLRAAFLFVLCITSIVGWTVIGRTLLPALW